MRLQSVLRRRVTFKGLAVRTRGLSCRVCAQLLSQSSPVVSNGGGLRAIIHSNLRKTRQLVVVYNVVKGGAGGLISDSALTHPNTRTTAFETSSGGSDEIPVFTKVLVSQMIT